MLSYVLLIVMTISLAVIVYGWLKIKANIEPIPECPEGTALVIQEYICSGDEKKIELTLRNQGRFNLEGFYIKGTDDKSKIANKPLTFAGGSGAGDEEGEGFYLFADAFKPNDVQTNIFSYTEDDLEKISIEPFRLYKEEIILCDKAVVTQEVDC